MMRKRSLALLPAAFVVAAIGTAAPQVAQAGAVIDNGNVRMGIFDHGSLGFGGVGINLDGVGDAIVPGCLCEGWGVAGNGISGNQTGGAVSGLSLISFSSTASTASSTVELSGLTDLRINQSYSPAVGAPTTLFQNVVTISNLGGSTITDIRYRRAMDWDVPPTSFNEFVTIGGLPATAVLAASDNGFATGNPLGGGIIDLASCGTNVNFTDCGPDDHGAVFDFGFGDLAAGQTKSFTIFYGAAPNEKAALAALGEVGGEIYSLGQSSTTNGASEGTPGTFIFAFKGVGGTPLPDPTPGPGPGPVDPVVPEPTTLGLLGLGMMVAGWQTRRSRS